jgi:hypothetical protein
MAKNIPNVEILTDTFNAWMLRTNDIIEAIRTEVLTANSSLGVTGSLGAPVNSRLWGAFTSNTLTADALTIGSGFTANSTAILIGPSIKLYSNNSSGGLGQVLTSTGDGVKWAVAPGTGTVTNLVSGNGVSFSLGATANTITSTGTINVRAGDGIFVTASGVSVNTAYLNAELNPIRLQGFTWGSPPIIGQETATSANAATFTIVTAGTGETNGYRITGSTFKITNDFIFTPGYVEATTPASGGGIRVKTNGSGVASISFTNNLGNELNNLRFSNNEFLFGATARYSAGPHPNVEIGFKTIPQIIVSGQSNIATINYANGSGAHYWKSEDGLGTLVFPNNQISFCPVGTAITFVNDSFDNGGGDIVLAQGVNVELQLAGTTRIANCTVLEGGVATALKVRENRWYVSGSGVV